MSCRNLAVLGMCLLSPLPALNLMAQTPSEAAKPDPAVVRVQLADDKGRCIVKTPRLKYDADYSIDARMGHPVEWRIQNNCSRDVVVGIGNFRPGCGFEDDDPKLREPYPLDETPAALFKRVPKAGSEVITARIKQKMDHHGRGATTYRYDFLEKTPKRTKRIGDPEIEIPK